MSNISAQPDCDVGGNASITVAALYGVMSLFGTILNILVVYLVVSFKKLRTASNAFIVNGCVSDLLVCAFWMPHEAVLMMSGGGGPFATGYHRFKDALLFLGITVSLLSHSLIAINRYVLITKTPATYLSIYQKRNTEWMISSSWLIALGFLLPWLSARQAQVGCWNPRDAASPPRGTIMLSDPYAGGTLVLTILGQTMVVLYCYFKIFRRVQISVKRVSILNFPVANNLPYTFPRKDRRLGLYVLAVCFIFLLTTQPLFCVLLAGLFTTVPRVPASCSWVVFCTLFVTNPFLYTWKNEEFRKSFRSVLKGEFWRGVSTVGVEPITINTISHLLPRQNSRRAFMSEIN